MSLLACPECNRHIRTSESVCPFCSADVAAAMASAAPRVMPAERLSRAAMMAFAAASLGAAACGSEVVTPLYGAPMPPDGSVNAGGAGGAGGASSGGAGGQMVMPLYGAPFPTGGTANSGGANSATGGVMSVPAYGIAPFPTGGASNSGGTQSAGGAGGTNASGAGGTMVMPLYGAPPKP